MSAMNTTSRFLKSSLWILILSAMSQSLSAQRLHAWSTITMNDKQAFSLKDSSAIHAIKTPDGYLVQRRVWVLASEVHQETLDSGSTLYDQDLKPVGQTWMDLVFEDAKEGGSHRSMRKHRSGLLTGHVTSSSFIIQTNPEREFERLLTQKRRGPLDELLNAYLAQHGFISVPLRDMPLELKGRGMLAHVLTYKHRSNTDEQPFKMIIITRGSSFIQGVIHHDQVLTMPKVKHQSSTIYGELQLFAKPTDKQLEALEELAYRFIPL